MRLCLVLIAIDLELANISLETDSTPERPLWEIQYSTLRSWKLLTDGFL